MKQPWGEEAQGCFLIPLKLDLWGGGEAREVGRWGEFLLIPFLKSHATVARASKM
jgi:hypothetical protein